MVGTPASPTKTTVAMWGMGAGEGQPSTWDIVNMSDHPSWPEC